MEIAILAFFLAIFGGVLFLLALIWFIFRRLRNSRQPNRKFSGGASSGGRHGTHHDTIDSDHDHNDAAAFYAGSSLFANQDSENPVYSETARDAATQSENTYSHESYGASAASAEPSDSSYDSGSSSDSTSSSDSGSSSSDSGSSSSSSSSD